MATIPSVLLAQDKKVSVKKIEEKNNWSNQISLGVVFWGQKAVLLASDGRTENIDIKHTGLSASYGIGYQTGAVNLLGELEAWILQGRAVSENVSIFYEDNPGITTPILINLGTEFKPSDNTKIGLLLGGHYSTLKLPVPASIVTTYEFKNPDSTKFTYTLRLGWLLSDRWSINQKIISFINNTSADTAWIVSTSYVF